MHTYLCFHPTSESNSGSVCVCVCGGRPAGFQGDPPHQDGGGKGKEWRAVAVVVVVVGRVEVGKRFGKHGGNGN